MNIAMSQFSVIMLIRAFILQTQNIISWATDGSGWSSTDGKFGKKVPTGSVKRVDRSGLKTQVTATTPGHNCNQHAYLPISPGVFHLTFTLPSSVLQQSRVERFPIVKAADSAPSATFHERGGERQPAAQSSRTLLFHHITDSQIFFRIQTAKIRATWVCHRWAKIDTSGSLSSELILY